MISGQTMDLFKLQKELIEAQVDMAVSRTIDRVVDQISALRNDMNSQIHGVREEMHAIRHEMRDGFSSLKTRVSNLETKLKIVNAPKKEVRSNFIRYSFKAVWAILGVSASVILSYLAIHFF